jgi:predicted nucleic acid-binding protein
MCQTTGHPRSSIWPRRWGDEVPRRKLLLDACVAINLAAAAGLDQIANALQVTFIIVSQAASEAGYLRDIVKGTAVLTPINLDQFASSETLEIRELAPGELALYLELASVVDDGEAATIALAIHQRIDLATDDRRARRLCAERGLAEPARTGALLQAYGEAAQLTNDEVRQMLIRVRDRASFLPARSDPHLKWWNDHIRAV